MTSRSARLASALAVAAVLGCVDGARAAEPLALTWKAPPECPQRAAVQARIDALVPAAAGSKERLEADGTIVRADGRFRLTLVMRIGELRGERQIESDSCKDLAGAAAVALGLMLQSADPSRETSETSSAPSSETTAPAASQNEAKNTGGTAPTPARPSPSSSDAAADAAAEEEARARDEEQRARDRARERGWAVLLHGPLLAFELGQQPNPSFGGALGGGVRLSDWRFSLDFQIGPTQSLAVSGEPRLEADVSRLALEAWICRAWRAEPFEVSPCLTAAWERVSAEGTGNGVDSRISHASFVSGGAGVFGHLFVSDFFAVMLGLGGRIEGARPHVLVESVGEVGQLGAAAFWAKAGPEWIF
jgi:hypothetical protein